MGFEIVPEPKITWGKRGARSQKRAGFLENLLQITEVGMVGKFGPYDDKKSAVKYRGVLHQVIYANILGRSQYVPGEARRESPFSTAIKDEDGKFFIFVRLDRKLEA